MTYPNQKIVVIQKEKVFKDFLQVSNDNWKEASRNLKDSSFRMYMYLSANANFFNLALSQKTVEEEIGVKKTAYHSAIKELLEKGYLVEKQGNIFYFFTAPVRKTVDEVRFPVDNISENELSSSQNDREIDKYIKHMMIDKESFSPSERNSPTAGIVKEQEERRLIENQTNGYITTYKEFYKKNIAIEGRTEEDILEKWNMSEVVND